MEDIVTLGIVAFFGYRFVKPIFDATNQSSKESVSKKVHDPQQMISMVSRGLNPKQPLREVTRHTSQADGELFKEDKWRRQLFLVCLFIGVGCLVYLSI